MFWGGEKTLLLLCCSDWSDFCVCPQDIWASSDLLLRDVFLMFKCKNGS